MDIVINRVARLLVVLERGLVGQEQIDSLVEALAQGLVDLLEIDEVGLEPQDRELLMTIIEKFHGGPVGIQALAAALGEDAETIEEINEPYLVANHYIKRTAQGRVAMEKTKRLFGINNNPNSLPGLA